MVSPAARGTARARSLRQVPEHELGAETLQPEGIGALPASPRAGLGALVLGAHGAFSSAVPWSRRERQSAASSGSRTRGSRTAFAEWRERRCRFRRSRERRRRSAAGWRARVHSASAIRTDARLAEKCEHQGTRGADVLASDRVAWHALPRRSRQAVVSPSQLKALRAMLRFRAPNSHRRAPQSPRATSAPRTERVRGPCRRRPRTVCSPARPSRLSAPASRSAVGKRAASGRPSPGTLLLLSAGLCLLRTERAMSESVGGRCCLNNL